MLDITFNKTERFGHCDLLYSHKNLVLKYEDDFIEMHSNVISRDSGIYLEPMVEW